MRARLDLTGQKIGRWTVIRFSRSTKGCCFWYCICKCGTQGEVRASYLHRRRSLSCGCLFRDRAAAGNANKFRDLTGRKFGRLKVEDLAFRRNKRFFWDCVCACGDRKIIDGHSLKTGATKSCGCLQRERASKSRKRAVKSQYRVNGQFARRLEVSA